eukprot:COSAG01_NODE_3802_length_5684_cov_2.050313_3_plen_67_part_00
MRVRAELLAADASSSPSQSLLLAILDSEDIQMCVLSKTSLVGLWLRGYCAAFARICWGMLRKCCEG